MVTEKRQRQKDGSRQRREEAVAERRRADRRRTIRNLALLAAAVIGLAVIVSLTTGDDKAEDVKTDEGSDTTEAPDPTSPASASPDEALGADGDDGAGPFQYGEGPCPPDGGSPEPVLEFEKAPQQCIDPAKTYTAVFTTNNGVVEAKLDMTRTPGTTNNFVALAGYGYYDGTSLFRTEKESGIVQGGSPHTQSADDPGPGYPLFDEGGPFLPSADGMVGPFQDYPPGTLAMARRPGGPDSAGAQFFFLARDAQHLSDQGTYVVFGTVTEGLDVLEQIADLDDGSGKPKEPVTIESVEIRES